MPSTEYKPHSHVPYGADGSGFYTDNTIGCFNVVEACKERVMAALDSVPATALENLAFRICDYGTADGGISMPIMAEVVAHIKKQHGKEKEISILYEDQPINDFKSLFLRLHALIPGPPSYLSQHKGVYISALGTGFYDQVVPSSSLHAGFSFTAMHWLSKRPCELTDAIHHVLSQNTSETEAWAKQAEVDWETNLLHRANELVTGGQLVIACFCVDDQGQFLGNAKRTKYSMYERMTAHWKNLMDAGKITKEEFEATTFNNYYRSVAEYSRPLEDTNSPVYKAGLRLKSIETKVVDCPYKAKWMKEGKQDDLAARKAHAKWFLPTTRTWSNSTFLSALSETRPQDEREAIVDELFQNYEDEVAENPAEHAMDYVHAYMSLYKV